MADSINTSASGMTSEVVQARLLALFGGPLGLGAHLQQRQKEFESIWKQDSAELGQVLHAHLVVEFFLTEYLENLFPSINAQKLGLKYWQKIQLLATSSPAFGSLVPGLQALGTIRNKIAHVRRVQIAKDDVQPMVNVTIYRMLLNANGAIDLATATPLEIVLSFAQFAAESLHSASDQANQKLAIALDPTQSVPGFEHFLPHVASDGVPGVGKGHGLFG